MRWHTPGGAANESRLRWRKHKKDARNLKRFAARHQVKQEPTDVSQDLSRSVDRSYSAAAPWTPTPVGEEDMASPVHPAPETIPASDYGSGHPEESDEDAMSQYSAQSRAQDNMEVGITESTVGALLSLDEVEKEDFLDELRELCELSMTLGDSEEAFRSRARDHIKASVAEIYSPPRVTKAATALSRLGIEPGAALDITTCDERGVRGTSQKTR